MSRGRGGTIAARQGPSRPRAPRRRPFPPPARSPARVVAALTALVLGLVAGLVLLAPCAAPAADGDRPAERRFALLVAEPDGGAGSVRLRYPERDARRMLSVLTRLGGVAPEDARLLAGSSADEVRGALAELSSRSGAARRAGVRTLLLFYYSGHARDGALRLRQTALELGELRRLLEEAPADVRIAFLDSCRSGAMTRAKGLRQAPAFAVERAADPRGLVLVTSSGADEDSQESDRIGGSFFTHHLASGLLGDADASGDGVVTLAEAYAHAYAQTVASTADTASGVQHPAYLYALGGAGDVVLTRLGRGGVLVFPAAAEGAYVVLDGSARAVAEVAKPAGSARRLSLPDGRYTLKKRLAAGDALLVGDVELAGAPVTVDETRFRRVPLERDPQKGFGGARWSLLGAGGGQIFFGPSASGYIPPAGLLGVEVAVRDDLGHDLAWGVDGAVGGGTSSLDLGGGERVALRFTEVSAGLGLWKDWHPSRRLTLSAGGRVALLYLTRTFPEGSVPSQYFLTVTPGITAGAAWRFSSRWSAVARGRGHYLFYNVDRNLSLGYAELLLGVEYALTPD